MRSLLEDGAKVDAKDATGTTALVHASNRDHIEIVTGSGSRKIAVSGRLGRMNEKS